MVNKKERVVLLSVWKKPLAHRLGYQRLSLPRITLPAGHDGAAKHTDDIDNTTHMCAHDHHICNI